MKKEDRVIRWSKLLGIDVTQKASAGLDYFIEHSKLDPKEQAAIRQDCEMLQRRLHYFKEADLKNTLELLACYYVHTEKLAYVSGLHEVLAPFFLLGFRSFKSVYACFLAFVKKMMPRVFVRDGSVEVSCKLLHTLLLYHEPALCSMLDAKMLSTASFAEKWFLTLFAETIDIPLLLLFWELCLTENNVTLPHFFAVVLVKHHRDQLLSRKSPKEQPRITLGHIDLDQLDVLCQEAIALQQQTPQSFIQLIEALVFAVPRPQDLMILNSHFSLSVTPEDLQPPKPGYVIIDLRPSAEYMRGHYPCSYNLASDLHITTGKKASRRAEEIWHVLTGFSAYFSNATNKSCHFAICSGELGAAALICEDLARRGVERVSVIRGGFIATAADHDSEHCPRCELNRDLFHSATHPGSLPRHKKILMTMWYSYLHEDSPSAVSTPVSSTASSPRRQALAPPLDTLSSSENTTGQIHYDTSRMPIREVVRLMWTKGLRDAEAYFEERKMTDPRCAVHAAEAAFLRALLLGDKTARTVPLEKLATAEQVVEANFRRLEAAGDQVLTQRSGTVSKSEALALILNAQQARLATAVYAETQLFRSGAHILHEAYIKGSLAFRNSWKLYQKCNKITEGQRALERMYLTPEEVKQKVPSDIEDDIRNIIKFGLGVLALSLSMAPQKVVRLAKVAVGMDADQTMGLKMLYECIQMRTGPRVPLALLFVLFWLLIYIPDFIPGKEDRHREAADLVRLGKNLYPSSPFFYWLESYLKQKQGQLQASLSLIDKCIRRCRSLGFTDVPPRLAFEKGWIYFLCQDWPKAVHHLLQSVKTGDPTPLPLLLLGISYCMQGNGHEAETWLLKLQSPEYQRNVIEKWISVKAKRFLSRKCFPLFALEVIYLTDFISSMSPDWHNSALSFLDMVNIDVPPLPQSRSFFSFTRPIDEESDEYVVYLLLRGTVLRHLGLLRDAAKAMELAIQYADSVQHESFAIPHVFYELGMVYIKGRDWHTAAQWLVKAKAMKKYDFRKSLTFKIEAAVEFLDKEEKKESRR